MRSELLLLDEPTTAVDAENESAVLASLLDLGDTTIVLVSHDPALVARHCDRVVHVQRQVRPRPLPLLSPAGTAQVVPPRPSLLEPEA